MEPEGSSTLPDYSSINISAEVQKWFDTVDTNHSGRITNSELQAALINCQGKAFSEETCRLLIKLFDNNKSDTIDINEFQHLYIYIKEWLDVFEAYDKDNSGYIEETELWKALNQMGYKLSENFVKILFDSCRKSKDTGMTLDEFITTCVKIQRLTNAFRFRDKDKKGMVSIGYEDYLEVILEEFL